MRYVMMAIVLVLTCLGLSTAQAGTAFERESLRGLPGVAIVIENIVPEAQAEGLTDEAIRTSVELILRSSGIRVLAESDNAKTPSAPWLYVGVRTVKGKLAYATCTTVSLQQQVALVQRPKHTTDATTWQEGIVTVMSTRLLGSLIPETIEPLVKSFANDFLSVNPR